MQTPGFNVDQIRADFPILKRKIGTHPLTYLDSAAMSLIPQTVLEGMHFFQANFSANIHRSPHTLGQEATSLYEQARENVARFISAAHGREVVFVRNTTEAINLVACSMMSSESETVRLRPGDEIMLTIMEHHSNMLPWQQVRDSIGVKVKIVDIRPDGTLDLEQMKAMISGHTRLICCTHISNVLGTINPIPEIASIAHRAGALLLVDGAQSVPHIPVDVKQLDCDFLAFSGHKMLAPAGIGVLYGREALLRQMTPFLRGGNMVKDVSADKAIWNEPPWKFEAGTPNICGGIALGGAADIRGGLKIEGAMDYLRELEMTKVHHHCRKLTAHALDGLLAMEGVSVHGPRDPESRGSVISFSVEKGDPYVIAQMLGDAGIAVRVGEHCAIPLTARLDVPATVRASFYLYNTREEVDRFLEALEAIIRHKLL